MRNKQYGPEVPADPVINKAEPSPNKKEPKRPVSGYGPSLGSRTYPSNNQ